MYVKKLDIVFFIIFYHILEGINKMAFVVIYWNGGTVELQQQQQQNKKKWH